MFIQTKAIVFHSTRYQEKSLIVKCFTEKEGVVSFFVPSIFSTKKNSSKIVYFQPLNILEIEFQYKKKGNLEYFNDYKFAFQDVSEFDISKNSILFFLAEVLDQVIKEQSFDKELYAFLETSILWLKNHSKVHNFHLILLIELSKYLGFYPDTTEKNKLYFDSLEGKFVDETSNTSLTFEETNLLRKLIDLKYSNEDLIFSKTERNILLNLLLNYYKQHNFLIYKTNSLEIFKEIF